jgi:hypothetical protein
MSEMENQKRAPVLDPSDRVSEIFFGLIMARTSTGSLNAASVGREVTRTKMSAVTGQSSATTVLTVPSR